MRRLPGRHVGHHAARGADVARYAIEVTGCHSHDNTLGYSGTGGDSNWVHDNEFDHNTGGARWTVSFQTIPACPRTMRSSSAT